MLFDDDLLPLVEDYFRSGATQADMEAIQTMDKVQVVAKILQDCVSHDVSLNAQQIDIILNALELSGKERDYLAAEMLAWRSRQARSYEQAE